MPSISQEKAVQNARAQLDRDEIVRRGEAIYSSEIRSKVESQHYGECLVLDVLSHDFEIDRDKRAAYDRLMLKRPAGVAYVLRIGFPAVERFGIRSVAPRK